MAQAVQLYRTNNGPCPYRNEGVWENLSFQVESLPGEMYEQLLDHGYRRSGCSIYHPVCSNCKRCIPIRIEAQSFRPTKSQRRVWRKNQDLHITHQPVFFSQEIFELYQKYQTDWHHAEQLPDVWEFHNFLINTPVNTEMVQYYQDDVLVGVGWIDCLPSLISSVYFIFDPEYASRRLGVYSILYEIEYCQKQNRSWLYLGYWVEDSPKMNYKADYRPTQILINNQWQPIDALHDHISFDVAENRFFL
ncbi:MAG: arginyltransferase [SAR324 cluster bacterium]|nr:arginyltransferase [SAR324 cluster bacterium]